MSRWRWRLAPDVGRGVRQEAAEGGTLGERLHAAWEWGAVVEQVAEFGWTALDVRWGQATHAHAQVCKEASKGPSARDSPPNTHPHTLPTEQWSISPIKMRKGFKPSKVKEVKSYFGSTW